MLLPLGCLLPYSVGLPAGASPPVFEQIFRNARFAQGGDALFEGKVTGNPKPTVSWTRKGAKLTPGNKYQVSQKDGWQVIVTGAKNLFT